MLCHRQYVYQGKRKIVANYLSVTEENGGRDSLYVERKKCVKGHIPVAGRKLLSHDEIWSQKDSWL